ncbi:MAG: hypothetical protein NT154_06695 [Verrucomicrobia bacterium]|nr:hypothetical protein [Verrucomicrobiota bacterium]
MMNTKSTVLATAIVIAVLPACIGQTVFWDDGGGNYSWHTAANWSNDQVPGPTNDVVIAVAADVTVTFSSGITYVRSVQCTKGFTLSGGLLILTEGSSQFDGPVTLGPNTSSGGGLYARGTGTVVTVNGPATYNGGALVPEQGGTLRLPGLRTLDLRTRNASFSVQDAGSVLDLSAVTNVLLAGNYYLDLGSRTGGRINLSQAAIPNGRVTASANGPESLIDLSSVQGVWSNSLSSSKSSLVVVDGGEIRMPGLAGLSHVDVSVYDPASRFTTAGLRSFVDGQFTVHQRTNDLAVVTNLANCTLVAESSSVVRLTNFPTLRVTNGSLTITVRGAGSLVDLSSVTNIVQTASRWLYLNAETGGRIDLSQASNPTGGIDFKADGVGSLIDLSAVQGMWSNLLNSAFLTVSGGGEILVPELTDLSRISLTVSGPASRFPTAQLRSIVGATLTVQQATNDFPSLTSILNSSLMVQNNGLLHLPNVTALWVTNANLTYTADGAQSRLDLSAVTNVTLAGNYSLGLSARNGGRIDLSRARLAEGAVSANANGTGSLIDLSSVQGVWGNRLSTSKPSFIAEAGGEIRMPGLTGLFGVNLYVIGPDSRFPTMGLQSFVAGTLTVGQTTNDFSSLTNLGSGSGSSSGLTVQNNSTLVVTNVSSLWLTNGPLYLSVTGPNSVLDLSGVTNVVIARTNSLSLQAQNGGSINLAQAQIPDGSVSATADGVGSLIDLSSVQGARNNTTGNSLSALTVTSGGEIRLPGLTDLYRVNLTINGQNSRFPTAPLRSFVDGILTVQQTTNDFSNLTNILNSDLTAQSYSALLLTNGLLQRHDPRHRRNANHANSRAHLLHRHG